jgi:hypothetical protein
LDMDRDIGIKCTAVVRRLNTLLFANFLHHSASSCVPSHRAEAHDAGRSPTAFAGTPKRIAWRCAVVSSGRKLICMAMHYLSSCISFECLLNLCAGT